MVDVVEDRAEGGEGEWWKIGWDGWGVRVVIGGGVGRVGEVEGQGGISVCNVKWEGGGVCICSGWPLGVG